MAPDGGKMADRLGNYGAFGGEARAHPQRRRNDDPSLPGPGQNLPFRSAPIVAIPVTRVLRPNRPFNAHFRLLATLLELRKLLRRVKIVTQSRPRASFTVGAL